MNLNQSENDLTNAIQIIEKYNSGVLKDNEEFYNLKWMQSHQLSD